MAPSELLEECARVARQYGLARAIVREGDVQVEIVLDPVWPGAVEPQRPATGGSPPARDELDELGAEFDRRRGAER